LIFRDFWKQAEDGALIQHLGSLNIKILKRQYFWQTNRASGTLLNDITK
jgi:hypothetical protein